MNYQRFSHHIQADIFAKLRNNAHLRYKDLKQPGLEPSQFAYHLKDLMKQKLVKKNEDGGYSLAALGVQLAQHFSSSLGNLLEAPLGYSLIFLRSTDGRWLLVRRGKHPHINKYACISGKIHMGESLQEAAKRELYEQTMGAMETELEYKGFASIVIREKDFLTHIVGPVWFADNCPPVDLPSSVERTSTDWHTLEILWANWHTLPYDQFIPGWKEIVAMIESGKPAYLDLSFVSS